ncbi:hypothetical protein [Telmatospirillum sp.]|uniref:hypothetical protein n=1 Tax=Telmatospirillum sp. TaxID=2079197 RepID=UPI002842E875|nr:hypothetical protein [Telmatospirillum sp.]MDR3436480.1 hypothetical protein [Telmatospirillum sp.]
MMDPAKRFFLFMTAYHQHHTTPEAKADYALTVLRTMHSDPECPEYLKARLWKIIASHLEATEEKSNG